MSVLQDAVGSIALKRIPQRLELYEALIAAAEPTRDIDTGQETGMFVLANRNLEEACKQHAQNVMTYSSMLQECKTIEDALKNRLEEIESELYKKLNENHSRALSQRDITVYLQSEPQVVEANKIMVEVILVRRKLEAIVDALKDMGWTLSHIVKLRVAQLEDTTL